MTSLMSVGTARALALRLSCAAGDGELKPGETVSGCGRAVLALVRVWRQVAGPSEGDVRRHNEVFAKQSSRLLGTDVAPSVVTMKPK